jgi:hypothetical protein
VEGYLVLRRWGKLGTREFWLDSVSLKKLLYQESNNQNKIKKTDKIGEQKKKYPKAASHSPLLNWHLD